MTRPWAATLVAMCVAFAAASIWLLSGTGVLAAGFFLPIVLFVSGLWTASNARSAHAQAAIIVPTVLSMAVVASIAFYAWPLRIAYAISQPAMDQIAEELRAGRRPTGPMWAGILRVRKAGLSYSGVPTLWIDTNPAGGTGFAQCGPKDPPFNLAWHAALDDRWQYVVED